MGGRGSVAGVEKAGRLHAHPPAVCWHMHPAQALLPAAASRPLAHSCSHRGAHLREAQRLQQAIQLHDVCQPALGMSKAQPLGGHARQRNAAVRIKRGAGQLAAAGREGERRAGREQGEQQSVQQAAHGHSQRHRLPAMHMLCLPAFSAHLATSA